MARRGGRRGRRSRSRQNRSRRTSSRSRRTSTRRSAPSSRRNTRSTTGRTSRSKQRSVGAGSRSQSAGQSRGGSRSSVGRTGGRNVSGSGAKNRGRTGVNASRGRAPTSRRQATRTTRQASPTRTNTRIASNVRSPNVKNYGLRPDGVTGSYKTGDVFNTGGKSGKDFRFDGRNFVPLAATNIAGLGIGEATASGYTPSILGNRIARDLGLDPATGRELPKGNPNVMSADGTFNRPGPGGPESEANYTSYQPGSFYNQSDTNVNMTNALRSGRNLVTSPFRALGINNGLTNRLIPKSNEAIQDSRDQRGPRPTLTRPKSRGGSSRIAQQAAATQMQPEIAPTIGQPIEETGAAPTAMDNSELTRIQNQAYNTQLTSSLANMFGGQGSVGYTPQGSQALSPTLRAGQSRGRRRVKLFGGRARRGGTGDQFSRAGDRIARLTNINV